MNQKNPLVTIELKDGRHIRVELFPDKAPNTVNNFLSLAASGFYDGVIFHRIIDGFMIQGGDPDGTGMGGPGYSIEGEFAVNGHAENDVVHEAGVISMARSMQYNSAGSQFFLMVAAAPHLDGQYAAFGRTADDESLAVCLDLGHTKTLGRAYSDRPVEPPVIKTISIDTKGVTYPGPQKIN
ncbi:MAG: peptidylprolyl isomerase [Eubacteriales bacterium]|nr:peptidylprolyl isomerase [Eubacteriales bacterium]